VDRVTSPEMEALLAQDPAGLVGRVLAERYEVLGLLGAGGIGRVYRARHLGMGREVAIKVLLEQYQMVPELQRRFEREARALASLSHPHIVTITDFVSDRSLTFLVMELIEGVDLAEHLRTHPLSTEAAFDLLRQILSSLAYAHAREVVHRDLKPQNIMVRGLPEGTLHATILDFGLAKFTDERSDALTKSGLIVGTPAYMAPEQASGGRADARADVYAVGVLLHELLTGQHPFPTTDGTELLRHHLLTAPPPLSRAQDADVHPALEALFARAMAKATTERFSDGQAMLAALLALPADAYLVRGKTSSRPAGPMAAAPIAASPTLPATPSQRRRRWRMPGGARRAGAVVAVLGAAAGGFLLRDALGPGPEAVVEAAPGVEREPEPVEGPAVEGATSRPAAPEATAPPAEEDAPAEAPPVPADPWTRTQEDAPPDRLVALRSAATRGDARALRAARRYVRRHRREPFGRLLLGHALFGRGGQEENAVLNYGYALAEDRAMRGDPQLLENLLDLATSEHEAGPEAARLLAETYGAEIAPVVDARLDVEEEPGRRARLETLRRTLQRAAAAP
jgi:tRNA A-37 threonylcarbamoyl transferase component Bud32